MDRVLRNDLALVFQLVSEKEKKRNNRLASLTKKIVDSFLRLTQTEKRKEFNATK